MKVNDKLKNILEDVRKVGYWKLPILSKIDIAIREQIENYRTAEDVVRNQIKSNLNDGVVKLLLFFSERMATHALRTGSQEVFDDGLMALEIVFGKGDIAEILICFSLYYDVSQKRGLSFQNFEEYDVSSKDTLQKFLSRDEEDKSIEAMGYIIEGDKSQQLSYKRNW